MFEKIRSVDPDDNVFFAGARLTNEELYLVQKLARAGAKTGNIGSFHYLSRWQAYRMDESMNTSFGEIDQASKIFLVGSEINRDNAVAGFMVSNARAMKHIPVVLVTTREENAMAHKVDKIIEVKSYYYFTKAVNHFLLTNKMENTLFLRDRVDGLSEYKEQMATEDYPALLANAGITAEVVKNFAEEYNNELNGIILYSEKEVSGNGAIALMNLAMITGKLGKTANGLIVLKEKNNAQGLFDMGINRKYGVGGRSLTDTAYLKHLMEAWKVDSIPGPDLVCLKTNLTLGKIKNIFIFGEDPVGCDITGSYSTLIEQIPFKVVQDYFMTDTAKMADLILPASFPTEIGGTFSNTQKVILEFDKVLPSRLAMDSIQQLIKTLKRFGLNGVESREDVFSEIIQLLPQTEEEMPVEKLSLTYSVDDNPNRAFNFGCDYLVKRFEEEFENRMKNGN